MLFLRVPSCSFCVNILTITFLMIHYCGIIGDYFKSYLSWYSPFWFIVTKLFRFTLKFKVICLVLSVFPSVFHRYNIFVIFSWLNISPICHMIRSCIYKTTLYLRFYDDKCFLLRSHSYTSHFFLIQLFEILSAIAIVLYFVKNGVWSKDRI